MIPVLTNVAGGWHFRKAAGYPTFLSLRTSSTKMKNNKALKRLLSATRKFPI